MLQQLVRKHISQKLRCLQSTLTLQQCCKEVLDRAGGLSNFLTKAVSYSFLVSILSNTIILHMQASAEQGTNAHISFQSVDFTRQSHPILL